jgi:hypothetical protein
MRTLETVKAGEATTSTRDAGQADVEEMRSMVETPQDIGKDEKELLELQVEREEPQQQP